MRSVFATRVLVEDGKAYMPGDRITSGDLYQHADYYASLGHVRIVEAQPAEDKQQRTQRKKAK